MNNIKYTVLVFRKTLSRVTWAGTWLVQTSIVDLAYRTSLPCGNCFTVTRLAVQFCLGTRIITTLLVAATLAEQIITFSKRGALSLNPLSLSSSPCPNFWSPENVQSAASCVPSRTSSLSPHIRMLKYAGEGSAPEIFIHHFWLSTKETFLKNHWVIWNQSYYVSNDVQFIVHLLSFKFLIPILDLNLLSMSLMILNLPPLRGPMSIPVCKHTHQPAPSYRHIRPEPSC